MNEPRAYYNEIDGYAADWLRNLIAAGHIAPGDVDTRDIRDVRPSDLDGYTQCHFFAGIGVWSYALRLAGWRDGRPAWTGSCPCQPFSAAGAGGGFADERHLWPHWHHLIAQRRPPVVFGEQVASEDGLAWVDLVSADLEGAHYARAVVDTCSAGIGAPHRRQRLRFVAEDQLADTAVERRRKQPQRNVGEDRGAATELGRLRSFGWMGDAERAGLERLAGDGNGTFGRSFASRSIAAPGAIGRMADADGGDAGTEGLQRSGQHRLQSQDASACDERGRPGPTNGYWRNADWLLCRDGKWRPVEPGTFPLAHGVAARVGRLRAYGNAIDAEATREFVAAYLDLETLNLEPERIRRTSGGPVMRDLFAELLAGL